MENLTAKQRSEITCDILQKRKIKKAKDKENMVYEVVDMAVNRCKKRNHSAK